jgi:hypothetical protein
VAPLSPRLNHVALSSSGIPTHEAITMERIAPEKANFFVRCNYDVGAQGESQKATVDKSRL